LSAGPYNYLFTLANVTNTGAPRMAVYYAMALRLRGHHVRLAFGGGAEETTDSIILEDMRAAGVACTHVPELGRPIDPRLPRRIAALAARPCKAVVGFTQRDRCVALLAARKLSAKGVIHGGNFHKFHGTFPIAQLKAAYYRYVVTRYCDIVVCTNKIILAEFSSRYGLADAQLKSLPNFIDVGRFQRLDPEVRRHTRARYGAKDGTTVLVTVARMDEQKGHLDLIEAFSRVCAEFPRICLWIAGGTATGAGAAKSEAYADEVRGTIRAKNLADRVRLLGAVSEIPQLHAAADIYVHAARWGGWDLGLLEGMACEKPAVFTDAFGRFDAFEDGVHGYCTVSGNVDQFTEALRSTLRLDPERRAEMGRHGRALICDNYSVEALSPRFASYIE